MRPKSGSTEIRRNKYVLYCAELVCVCVVAAAAFGQTNDIWLGGQDVWSNANMWSNGVPNGNFNVFIDNGNPVGSQVGLDMSPSIQNLTIDSDDGLYIESGLALTVNGTSINAGSGGLRNAGTLYIGGPVALYGGMYMQGGVITGLNGQQTLTIQGEIGGWGNIGQGNGTLNLVNNGDIASGGLTIASNDLTNNGTVNAYCGSSLVIDASVINQGTIGWEGKCRRGSHTQVQLAGSLTNTGSLVSAKNGFIDITGSFNNFSGTTLTGGTYAVSGTFQFNNANIVTNAAKVKLSGTTSQIVDQSGDNALANFSSNAAKALFSLASGKTVTTPVAFKNEGTVQVGTGTSFQASSYTQTAGTTKVDGTLSASGGVNIQAGKLLGKGTIASTLVSSGSLTTGDSASKPRKLSVSAYTQNAAGSLNVPIYGVNPGTQYGQVAVANGASLNGILNVKLANGFIPAIGSTFTILTASAVNGQFTTVNGLSINGSEHFQIAYNANDITLAVVSGAK